MQYVALALAFAFVLASACYSPNCDPARGGYECQSGYCDTNTPNLTCADEPVCI